jgi:hypothetical protein
MSEELEMALVRLVKKLNIVQNESYLELYFSDHRPPEIAKDVALACFIKQYEDQDTGLVREYLDKLYSGK